jgi:pyruvate ferredoxin oxidoreductase alpha subunit
MLEQIEGSLGVARAVALCRPEVISAYPISPQTHIVEALSDLVRTGDLTPCEYLMVESEFGAMSACIGASAAGARTYTATSSQGLLFMAEALFNASGLGLPIVMTVANRAIGAPINIWNDHSDSMSQRDCGWIQVYAETNQAAADLHVLAFRLAETLNVPAMVCVDGFVLTHAFEPIDVPDAKLVDRFLPHRRPTTQLDPDDPVTIGAMVGPEAFTEVRYLAHAQLLRARECYAGLADEWERLTGRSLGILEPYGPDDAETVVLTLGSVAGTVQDVVDARGDRTGLLTLRLYRPFPADEVRQALAKARRVIVLERAFAPGAGGVVSADVQVALAGTGTEVSTVVAGLGGRPVTADSVHAMLDAAAAGRLPRTSFLDLDQPVVDRELAHLRSGGRS